MTRLARVALGLLLFLALAASARGGSFPGLELYWGKTVEPGEVVGIRGNSWFPQITGCEMPVHLTLTDSGGHSLGMGTIKHRNDDFVGEVSGFKTIPVNARAGKATLRGRQELRVGVRHFGCFTIGSHTIRLRNVTVLGESGNDPPVIGNLAAEDAAHGSSSAIRWSQSEAAATTVTLSFLFTPKHPIVVGTLLSGDRPAGANAIAFDGMFDGQPLPLGRYRVKVQAKDASGAFSAIKKIDFSLGVG
jgi:hypothetical protein